MYIQVFTTIRCINMIFVHKPRSSLRYIEPIDEWRQQSRKKSAGGTRAGAPPIPLPPPCTRRRRPFMTAGGKNHLNFVVKF